MSADLWTGRLRRHAPVLTILLLSVAGRAALLWAGAVPFNSDEAVVALMARHILQGARPIFFYGQAYLGSLDAWLVAGAFRLLGESVLAVRAVQIALYCGTILSAYALALAIYQEAWAARLVALWLAIPPVLLTVYTTASLGGYGEALLLGNLLWLTALRLRRDGSNKWLWAALGALSGLGLWVLPLVGVYALPAWLYVGGAQRPWAGRPQLARWALACLSAGLGAGPWLWYTLARDSATLSEMAGAAIADVSGLPAGLALLQQAASLLIFAPTVVSGLRPPWSVAVLALPLAPLALAVYSAALIHAARRARGSQGHAAERRLLWGTALTLCAAFVLTPFGADPSGRYFLPLTVILAFFTAELLAQLRGQRRWLAHGLGLGLLAFNAWGTLQSAASGPGLTTQFDPVAQVNQRHLPALMAFLRAHGETRGYTNYWVTFPLAFLSGEDLIFAARLPYHLDFRYTPRDDRYAPYTRAVEASPRVAYLTTRHPPLDERLRAGLAALGVGYREHAIGDFRIFYALSRKVEPAELGLGTACCP